MYSNIDLCTYIYYIIEVRSIEDMHAHVIKILFYSYIADVGGASLSTVGGACRRA